jgi:hypothetical protein
MQPIVTTVTGVTRRLLKILNVTAVTIVTQECAVPNCLNEKRGKMAIRRVTTFA